MVQARPLLVLGNRTFAVEIADVASESGYRVEGFIENLDPDRCKATLEGLPVHWVEDLAHLAQTHVAVSGLATTKRARFTDQIAQIGMAFATVVHPTARVSQTTDVAEGVFVSVGVIVGARSRIGPHVIVNRGSLIGHHTDIGAYSSVQPGANIAGACNIGERTWIGMGATVIDHVSIGADSVVGAGAVVTKDLPDRVLAVGVPARVVKDGIDGK